ncbi:MAG: methylglutaconyl-CoA hydratase [Frankiales bacterium]|nr:methylglutaconyl-CoA hydratase [Frankiales bacterium]
MKYEATRGVAVLTLDEVDNRNALNARLINGLGDGLTRAVADDAVRVVLLTHEGPVFCAGADLKGGGQEPARFGFPEVLTLIQDSPKPVVAVLRGPAMGGGVGLAAAADLSLASTDVTFGFTEVRIGLAPAMISVVCLPKLSKADAAELFLTGRKIPAARAAEVGLINRAVAPDDLDAAVAELLRELVAGSPQGLATSKELLRDVPGMPRAQAFEHTQALSARLFQSPEAAEGIAAFRERRPASWIPHH